MKLILLFLFITFQASAIATAQQISLNAKNTPIEKVLRSIQKQTGYSFVMDAADLKYARPVTLTLKSSSIETVLQTIFSNQPFNYRINNTGKIIMIQLKEAEKKNAADSSDRKRDDITGIVTDKDGKPLPGATVKLKDGSQGTTTDANGRFRIASAPTNGTLVISMIGRESKQITYKSGLVSSIVLLEVNAELKEIQVIAYGEVEKRFSTSNVNSISGEVISRQPVSNPLISIQGRVPGLFIRQSNGLNTGAVNVTVQGRNSINNSNIPFYVIDGVPFTPSAISRGARVVGSIGVGEISNLNFLNPNEIESITILKDADATAIYGARAANGAILITTKKGKAGQTKVDLNLQTGWGKVANRLKMLNIEQYIALKKEAYVNNNNQTIPATSVDINGTWDPNRNIDWQEELIGGTAQYQNLQASVSGGGERTQFLAGVGYIRETPVFKGNFSNIQTSVNFNVNHASANQKFRFFLSGSYLEGNNQLPIDDISERASTLAPNTPDLYNADGTVNWAPVPDVRPFQSITPNPAAMLLSRYTNKSGNLIANSNISYELMPGLVIRSTFGYNSLQNDESGITPSTSLTPQDRSNGSKPFANFADKSVKSWIIEPQLSYTKPFKFGILDALLGSTFQSTESYMLGLRGEEYNNDVQLADYASAGKKSTTGSIQALYNYSAIFGRLNYRVRDRYILNFAIRRDGSSRFGSENLFHNFYSVGGAWIFSEENLLKNSMPLMNYGKIRVSYGTTGNDQIGDYQFYSLYTSPYGIGNNYLGVPALAPNGLPNPYLQWEETRKLNYGLDLGFFDSKILLTVNYFRNRSSNQLLSQNLSTLTGFSFITRNLPAVVQNTGWEFNLQYNPIKGKTFSWQGGLNITLPKNKLIRYDDLDKSNDRNLYVIDESISLIKAYSFAGVNPQTGLYQFRTTKGELTSSPKDPDDKTTLLTTDPKWYGGFSNTLTYKGISLDFFFNFVSQVGSSLRFSALPNGAFNNNYVANVVNRWHKPGDVADIQKVTANFGEVFGPYSAATQSDAAYKKITYGRLSNAVLAYNFNSELTKRIHIANARLFIQGQNLFTITGYKIGDPEIQSVRSLGLLRKYTLGAQLTF